MDNTEDTESEVLELQEAYDIAMDEITRLRKELGYDRNLTKNEIEKDREEILRKYRSLQKRYNDLIQKVNSPQTKPLNKFPIVSDERKMSDASRYTKALHEDKTGDRFQNKSAPKGCGEMFQHGCGEFICDGSFYIGDKQKFCPKCEKEMVRVQETRGR